MTADEHIPKDSTNRIFSLKNATSNVLINWLQVYNIHLSNLNKAFNIFLNLLIYIKSNSKTFNNSSNLRFQVPCTGSFKLCFIRLEIYIIHYNIHSWESDFWNDACILIIFAFAQVILLYFSDAMTYTLCVFTYRSPIIPLMYSPYRKTQKSFIFTSKKYEY